MQCMIGVCSTILCKTLVFMPVCLDAYTHTRIHMSWSIFGLGIVVVYPQWCSSPGAVAVLLKVVAVR